MFTEVNAMEELLNQILTKLEVMDLKIDRIQQTLDAHHVSCKKMASVFIQESSFFVPIACHQDIERGLSELSERPLTYSTGKP